MIATAAVLQQDNRVSRSAGPLSRAEVLARYRQFREIGKQHHSAVLKFVANDGILTQARRLGLAQGKTLILDSMNDLNLVFDLLIYTTQMNRSRAIDRYARSAQPTPETDEAMVLEAMQHARFSIITCTRRHPVAGLVVQDLFRGTECWLIDEGLERSLPDGAMLATRLYSVDGFSMTSGVIVPLDIALIEQVLADTPQLLRKSREAIIGDRRFAEVVYRTAVVSGIMEQVAYQDTITPAN